MIDYTNNRIHELYDTFLARFAFFRKHIKVMLDFWENMQQMSESMQTLEARILDLEVRNRELEGLVADMDDKLTAPTKDKRPETSRDLMRTSQDIMQSIYSNYYSTGEALPDRQ